MPFIRPTTILAFVALSFSLVGWRAEAQNEDAAPKGTEKCVPVPDGLVGWWPGDKGARNRLGNNHGEASEGLNFATGKVGNAFSFTVADALVKIPPISDLSTGGGLAIEGWIRPKTTDIYPIVDWNDGKQLGVHLWVFDVIGRLFFNIVDSKGGFHVITSGPGIIKRDVYQHIAATYDKESGIARLYRNGVLMAEDYMGKFNPQTSYDLYFGHRPSVGQHFKGELDEICIYNRALTFDEVQAVYAAGSAGHCAPEE